MAKVENGVDEVSENQFSEFIEDENPVIIDFFAEWCMPCLMMAPVIEEMKEKFKSKIKFGKVNVDENSELAQKYSVMSIPVLVVFKNGKEVDRITGAMQAEQLQEKLKQYL